MNGYKIVLLKAIFMLYKLPECERVCSGICICSYIWILLSNISINWFIIKPQSEIGIVHFFSISISERYMFFTASSEGNESFDFVYFLIFTFRFSIRFVV